MILVLPGVTFKRGGVQLLEMLLLVLIEPTPPPIVWMLGDLASELKLCGLFETFVMGDDFSMFGPLADCIGFCGVVVELSCCCFGGIDDGGFIEAEETPDDEVVEEHDEVEAEDGL